MNIIERLKLEQQPDLAIVAGIQGFIRQAIIEDNEAAARHVDTILNESTKAEKIAALYIAQQLYNLRNMKPIYS